MPSEIKILDKISMEIVESIPKDFSHYATTLYDWCNHNTGSRNYAGLLDFLPKLEAAFAPIGGTIERAKLKPEIIVTENGQKQEIDLGYAMHLCVRPEAPIQLVFTGHYDTVFAKNSHFQYLEESSGNLGPLNGPGAADMKGGLLVIREALLAFERHPQKDKIGYEVLISPDEEIGSLGSAHLLAKIGTKSDLGLTYEPALPDGSMAGARKGSANFSLIIRGKSAHVGRAHHEGKSAILAAAQFVCAIESLNSKHEGLTINCGKVDGGSANNVVPDLAIVRFNLRAPSSEAMSFAIKFIESEIAKLREDDLNCQLEGGISRPPKPRSAAQLKVFDDVSKIANELGIGMEFKDTGGVCEGNNLYASGCPNIDTLGVRGGLIHSDKEFVIRESFGERARLSAAILCAYAIGAIDAKAPRKLMEKN